MEKIIKKYNSCAVPAELFFIERGCFSKTEIREREIYMHLSCMWSKDGYSHLPLPAPSPPTRDKRMTGPVSPASPPPLSTDAFPMAEISDFQGFRPKRRTASI